MKIYNLLLLFVLALFLATSANAKIVYEVIDLGTLGGVESCARSINDAGQIVGSAYYGLEWWEYHATLFDSTGAGNNIDLGTLGVYFFGGYYSSAQSINEAGQIVGDADTIPSTDIWVWHATLFDHTGAGNNIDLGTLGGDTSGAHSINNAGQIVGDAVKQNWVHATLFDSTGAGNNIDLGTLGGHFSEAFSINDTGQIVGAAAYSQLDCHATLFDPTGAGNNIDLGTLGGRVWSRAWSINNSGQIVGEAFNNLGYRATLFDPTGAGNNIDLGTLGGDQSRARSINDTGQIVGYAHNSQGEYHATLFDPSGAGNNIDLNTLIDPASGWTLKYAYDINASGWIVGSGVNPQGETHAFQLVPKPQCVYELAGDLNDDCRVDFYDFAVMATNWLVDCGLETTNPACVPK